MRTVGGTASTAIDFGTTHTVASVATGDGRVQSVLFDSSPLLSSAVYAGEDRLVAGRDAERSARLDPSRFEPNPKRHIDDGTLLLGAREYPITEVVAAVLGRALADANRVAGGPTGRVPLTYPANWSGQRRGLLVDAGGRAGAGHVTLIPEPVAAAMYFTTVLGQRRAGRVRDRGVRPWRRHVRHERGTPGGRRRVRGGRVRRPGRGGLDLDAVVVDLIGRTLSTVDRPRWARLVERGDAADRGYQRALWDEARAAKEQLSRASSAAVRVPLFDIDAFVTREEFEAAARPALERTVELTAITIARTGLGRAREQRPDLMGTADVQAVWRIESARIVAALTRFTGDFGLAEDAAQEAVAEALVSWPLASPANPAGWLMATARRRAIDAIRRRTALQDRYALLAVDLAVDSAVDEEIDPDKIDDDVLALMFVSCHPMLSPRRPG